MADFSDLGTAARAVMDPSTSAADLASIAQLQPGLRAQVAGHQNAYPGLLQWLASQGDESTRAVVAARTGAATPTMPVSVPVQASVAQASAPQIQPMPMQAPVTYQPVAQAPVQVAPKSKRPLIIGIVAVVVVAAIAATLLIWKPWQKASSSGPTLTGQQFAAMLEDNPTLFGQLFDQSAPDLQAQMEGPVIATPNPCGFSDDWVTGTGATACNDAISGTFTGSTVILLFDTVTHASDWGSARLADWQGNDGTSAELGPTTVSGVWMWGFPLQQGGSDIEALAQYGNVCIIHVDEPGVTWDSWQAAAAALKTAVDGAAKH